MALDKIYIYIYMYTRDDGYILSPILKDLSIATYFQSYYSLTCYGYVTNSPFHLVSFCRSGNTFK